MDPDAYLLHQVHPAKVAADVGASLVSTVLLWRGRRRAGLLVRYAAPALASVAVLRTADLAPLRETTRGRYVLAHMTPMAVALRMAGDTMMTIGASRRSTRLTALGALTIVAGWSRGAVRSHPRGE